MRALMGALRERLHKRIELRSVGTREAARLCGDHGLLRDEALPPLPVP